MFDYCNMLPPVPYAVFNGLHDGESTRTGLFNLFAAHELTGLFSGFNFWSDLTSAILDHYLNTFLRSNSIVDDFAKHIHFDRTSKIWEIDNAAPIEMFASALAGKFTETEATFNVMTQENLNIVEFNDIDRNVYGAKSVQRDYDKVEIDVTNGATTLTDVFGARSYTRGGGTDTNTTEVAGFNSSGFSNKERTTTVEASRSDSEATRTDTHSTAQVIDNTTTKARQDEESFSTYTDVLTHTKHVVLSPDAYFTIQKEMADYNLYKSVADAVKETICKGVWL